MTPDTDESVLRDIVSKGKGGSHIRFRTLGSACWRGHLS